ncbi:hypothetical protein [Streptomyces phaeochromogenes]|uniref:hypothetical protein n=1 Tax=Streptomyces phaeochromogenes TaxID=1923 RepID=UPI002E0F80CB|nr:hypothetical protein OG437_50800 [Streptomyces phaeochromogenes]
MALVLAGPMVTPASAQPAQTKAADRTSCHEWQLSDGYQVLCHYWDEHYTYQAYADCGPSGGAIYRVFGPVREAVIEGQGARASIAECGSHGPAVGGGLLINP